MPISIFYSWQSDLPNNGNRSLIRRALDQAVRNLNANLEIEDVVRVDQDTDGVAGSPNIAETILRKIDDCAVFVPDVTFVTGSDQERWSPNPNVMIEYGYALKSAGDARIVAVFNTAFGNCENLPFDLRHKRWPIRYAIGPDASDEERQTARNTLASELENALGTIVERVPLTENASAETEFMAAVAKDDHGASFLDEDEVLGSARDYSNRDAQERDFWLRGGAKLYMRLWPDMPIDELSNREVRDLIQQSNLRPMCSRQSDGWSYGRNQHGAFSYYKFAQEPLIAVGITQLFRSGEVWGIDTDFANYFRQGDGENLFYLPTGAIESEINFTLQAYLDVCRDSLNLPLPLNIQVGLTGIQGYQLAVEFNQFHSQYVGRIVVPSFQWRGIIDDYHADSKKILLPFFEQIYDEAGVIRPTP